MLKRKLEIRRGLDFGQRKKYEEFGKVSMSLALAYKWAHLLQEKSNSCFTRKIDQCSLGTWVAFWKISKSESRSLPWAAFVGGRLLLLKRSFGYFMILSVPPLSLLITLMAQLEKGSHKMELFHANFQNLSSQNQNWFLSNIFLVANSLLSVLTLFGSGIFIRCCCCSLFQLIDWSRANRKKRK